MSIAVVTVSEPVIGYIRPLWEKIAIAERLFCVVI